VAAPLSSCTRTESLAPILDFGMSTFDDEDVRVVDPSWPDGGLRRPWVPREPGTPPLRFSPERVLALEIATTLINRPPSAAAHS